MLCFFLSAVVWTCVGTILIARTFSTRLSRTPRETCAYCGYSLHGDCSYRCPECGKPQPHPWHPKPFVDPDTRRLFTGSAIALLVSISLVAVAIVGLHMFHRISAMRPPLSLFLALLSTLASFALVCKGVRRARRNGSSILWWPLTIAIASLLFASGIMVGFGVSLF